MIIKTSKHPASGWHLVETSPEEVSWGLAILKSAKDLPVGVRVYVPGTDNDSTVPQLEFPCHVGLINFHSLKDNTPCVVVVRSVSYICTTTGKTIDKVEIKNAEVF